MAGSVTGNLGSENITLRNMATEDTLVAILEVMREQKGQDGKEAQLRSENNQTLANNTKKVKEGSVAWGKFFDKLTEGPIRILRNLDSEINNASYAFSAMTRDGGAFSKTMQFAATSVAQMQEQYNAYSKMMQVGGVIASDFETLKVNANNLGTDLTGLTRITEQYSQSLKIGSSTTAIGLKKLKDTFKAVTDDTEMLQDFGRLGVLPQQISEQLLLAAEAQGGFGQVMKKYGGDAKLFGAGMLKSTQELNMFATAVGANSQMMQTEAAKAAKRTSDQLFLKTLSAGEQQTYQYMQTLTGSAEVALEVMRSIKTGITSQEAGLFLATKGITGMGNEMNDFMNLVSKGTEPLEALSKSGLMTFAKSISDDKIQELVNQEYALRKGGNTQLADLMNNQLTMIRALRDSSPEEIKKQVDGLKSSLTPDKKGTTDTFVSLQDQQVRLAQSTAGLNAQFNRLGILLAGSAMTGLNRGIHELGKGTEMMKKYVKDTFNVDIPDEIAKKGVDAIADEVNRVLKDIKVPTDTQTSSTSGRVPVGAPYAGGITPAGQVNLKMPSGEGRLFNLKDVLTNQALHEKTEALKGKNTQLGTLITGALFQQKIPTLGAITAGSDADPSHSGTGKHPKGLALDFRVNDVPGRDPETVYRETIAAMEQVLMKDLGLKKGDYYIENERTKGNGPHIHFQFQSQAISDKVREYYQSQIKAAEDSAKPAPKTETSEAPKDNKTQTSSAPLTGTVNNNMSVATTKPEWLDSALEQNQSALKSMTAELGSKFDNMYDMLKRKIG